IATGATEHHHDAAGHVFTAVVASALDHGGRARIAHREALAGDTAGVALALDRSVEHGVADNDRFIWHDGRGCSRADDDAAPGEALADMVVGVAFQLEGHTAREPGAKTLPGRAGEPDVDGVVAQPVVVVALGDHAGKHRAGSAVG